MDSLSIDETTNIHDLEYIQRESKKSNDNLVVAHVTFSIHGDIFKERNVDVVPIGDEFLVTYKFLEEDVGLFEKGPYDVQLIVPENFKIE